MTKEVCIVPTFGRNELLFCCLKRIRAVEPNMEIHVFPDRGTFYAPLVQQITKQFEATVHLVPNNSWYGNTANTMNAYLWAFNAGYDRVFYVESDVIVHNDFFSWHRDIQEDCPDIFCSMAWIFNRVAPITNDVLFQPWFYSIGVCFSREKLALVAKHATPKYYEDMPGYIEKRFKASSLNIPSAIAHVEQDGLIQRILDEDRSQSVSPGIAKCSHIGFTRSYGSGDTVGDYNYFLGGEHLTFEQRVANVESFIADPYARASIFGRALVEREIGHELPPRLRKYLLRVGPYECEYESELKPEQFPKRLRSVPRTPEMQITLI